LQVTEMARMEQQMRALSDERDNCIKTTKQLEAQIQQAESAQKMQMDRANERQKNYERALYDTRQVLAMKDAKIATLESNLQKAGGGQVVTSALPDVPLSGSFDARQMSGSFDASKPTIASGLSGSLDSSSRKKTGSDAQQTPSSANKRVSFREQVQSAL
jgi:hypothetical protein